MPYTFDKILAADPERPELVASNGLITIFAPGDPTKTPVQIKSAISGVDLPNPLPVNAAGWGDAIMHDTMDRLAWEGGGFSGMLTSHEGIKDEAVAARQAADESRAAAQEAAAEARAPADDAVERGIQRANLPGQIAHGIAAQPSVATAAAAAVESAIEGVDIVTGKDSRILQRTMDADYAIPFLDRDGYMAGGFTSDGRLSLFKPMNLPVNAVQPGAIAGMTGLDPSTGYIAGALDKDGYMGFGVTTEGAFRVFKGDGGVASRTKIACFGDSLTRGYTGGTAWDISESWPSKLAQKLPGIEVTNLGFGGNTADEIRIRSGAKDIWLSPVGGSIPASGEVAVTTRQNIGFIADGNISFDGYLAGIFGTFRRTGGVMTFTRRSAGVGVPVPAPARFKVVQPDYSGHTAIIWLGRNDVSYDVTGAESTVAEHVVAATIEMVEWLTPRMKQVIVVGTTNRLDEPRGTAKYNTVVEINQRLAQLLPGKYMDVRTWLVNRAIYDAGITPTQADLDAIARDTPPPQIMDGGSHYNKPIAPLLATMFHTRLIEKGYI